MTKPSKANDFEAMVGSPWPQTFSLRFLAGVRFARPRGSTNDFKMGVFGTETVNSLSAVAIVRPVIRLIIPATFAVFGVSHVK